MTEIVRTARFVLTIEVAFSLVGVAILTSAAFATFNGSLFLLLLLYTASITAVMGWLVSRWASRKAWVRWGAIAAAVASAGGSLVMVEPGLVLAPRLLLPLVAVIALLTPPAGRWFDR
ncbi:hypothetical protein [Nonomuraea longicatena]|uniref:Integral membrane protein n=1 Tax=Nonomuraea longicatena TaxID=83682 RepID=A0ABN1PNW0_9ACTN